MTPRPHRARVGALSFAVSLALVGLPACGEDDTASEDTSTTESAPTSAATDPWFTIEEPRSMCRRAACDVR